MGNDNAMAFWRIARKFAESPFIVREHSVNDREDLAVDENITTQFPIKLVFVGEHARGVAP